MDRWIVRFTNDGECTVRNPMPFVELVPAPGPDWQKKAGLTSGTPFLISPLFGYDVELNEYLIKELGGRAAKTKEAAARDLASFLTFLWKCRDKKSWKEADEDDHLAYLTWRRRDPDGPNIAGTTWDREVALVNQFYWWAVRRGYVDKHPIPQRVVAHFPRSQGLFRRQQESLRPATYSHVGSPETVAWLPPAAYRRWRDVGVRGYGADGLPCNDFRGRWAARNALYCDLMIRTGLRVSEQSALSIFEVPDAPGNGGYKRFWLPVSIAKGDSARWIYVPPSLISDIRAYSEYDRAAVIAEAQAAGRYDVENPWIVEDRQVPVATRCVDGTTKSIKISQADSLQRRSIFIRGAGGLEPISFWLSDVGTALSVFAWKYVFADANDRCERRGVDIRCHPHALRHSFAVATLEQLQRGHIDALARLNSDQRRYYVRVFGDPLDWVRRRLGHKSVTTTMVYLHALSELEMETRMALIPSDWEEAPLTSQTETGFKDADPEA